jgi:hypothetical protein
MVVLRAENIFSQSLAGVDIMGCPQSSITQIFQKNYFYQIFKYTKILKNILQKILLKSYILCHPILNKYLVIR